MIIFILLRFDVLMDAAAETHREIHLEIKQLKTVNVRESVDFHAAVMATTTTKIPSKHRFKSKKKKSKRNALEFIALYLSRSPHQTAPLDGESVEMLYARVCIDLISVIQYNRHRRQLSKPLPRGEAVPEE